MSQSLTALRQSADLLRRIQEGLGPDQVERPAYPSEWTIAQVFSHLGSGAVIGLQRYRDVLAGAEPDPGFNQATWDEWNAKAPAAQVGDAVAADQAMVAALEAATDGERAGFHTRFGPFDLDFDGYAGLRLGEHALHTWDVAVALDPAATLPPFSAEVLIDSVARLARLIGRAGSERTVHVTTSGPERRLAVAVGADAVEVTAGDPAAEADLRLPAEAFVRLVYGRLDPAHTPAFTGDEAVLDGLRTTFPGF